MLKSHNPADTHELLTHGAARDRDAFVRGVIGEVTYRVTLEILGLRGQDVTAEIALALHDRRDYRRQNQNRKRA